MLVGQAKFRGVRRGMRSTVTIVVVVEAQVVVAFDAAARWWIVFLIECSAANDAEIAGSQNRLVEAAGGGVAMVLVLWWRFLGGIVWTRVA